MHTELDLISGESNTRISKELTASHNHVQDSGLLPIV